MKGFVYTTFMAIALSASYCTAEQNAEFRERAEIYSSNVLHQSKSIPKKFWCKKLYKQK